METYSNRKVLFTKTAYYRRGGGEFIRTAKKIQGTIRKSCKSIQAIFFK